MIRLRQINKRFGDKEILCNFELDVNQGEFLTITGQSGVGKTTLLNIMGFLDRCDKGFIEVCGVKNPTPKQVQELRKHNFAYVFQNYLLMNNMTVLSNLKLAVSKKNFSKDKAVKAINDVGLCQELLNKKVCELSGGEQQRVAIARVLMKDFDILLADEPTGNLDQSTKQEIASLLVGLKAMGKTIVCVTHDQDIVAVSDRFIRL